MRRQDRQNFERPARKNPKKCVVIIFCFCAYSRFVWHSRLTRWIHGKRESLLWGVGGAVALAVILLSCSTTNRTILAPPSIPGAEFVGSEECATCHEQIVRDFRTATHARLQTKKVIVSKSSAKGGGEISKESTDMGCESCHGPGSLHVKAGGGAGTIINPRKSPETCFQCHLEVRAAFAVASSSSGARRQNELRRLSRGTQRHRDQRRADEYSAEAQSRRACVLEPKRNVLRVSHTAARSLGLRARGSASRLCGLPFAPRLCQPAPAERTQCDALSEMPFPGAKNTRAPFSSETSITRISCSRERVGRLAAMKNRTAPT